MTTPTPSPFTASERAKKDKFNAKREAKRSRKRIGKRKKERASLASIADQMDFALNRAGAARRAVNTPESAYKALQRRRGNAPSHGSSRLVKAHTHGSRGWKS